MQHDADLLTLRASRPTPATALGGPTHFHTSRIHDIWDGTNLRRTPSQARWQTLLVTCRPPESFTGGLLTDTSGQCLSVTPSDGHILSGTGHSHTSRIHYIWNGPALIWNGPALRRGRTGPVADAPLHLTASDELQERLLTDTPAPCPSRTSSGGHGLGVHTRFHIS